MKGRASAYGLLALTRRLGALKLACGVIVNFRWIPSEDNHSDERSRIYSGWHCAQASRYAEPLALARLVEADKPSSSSSRTSGNANGGWRHSRSPGAQGIGHSQSP